MTLRLFYAAELFRLARDMGVALSAEGGRLRCESAAPLTPELIATLKTWKEPLLAYLSDSNLSAQCVSASPEDALDLRQERAAILEHDGGLTRNEAERKAGLK